MRVVLTNQPTRLGGVILDEKKQPADGTVVVFPEETSRWREDSRTIRAARPDQRGEFSIKGLPAGKYLIAAVDYVQDGQWYDPEFLAGLRPRAQPLSLAEAENKRVDRPYKNSSSTVHSALRVPETSARRHQPLDCSPYAAHWRVTVRRAFPSLLRRHPLPIAGKPRRW